MGTAPPFLGDGLLQSLFYFKGCLARGQLQTVRHTEHMRVYGNGRRIKEDAHEYVRRLAAYAGELRRHTARRGWRS